MDLVLSLPIVSYFFSSSVASWPTSLNLLFFYVTWTTLVLSHPPLKVHLTGLLALRTALCLVPSVLFLLLDSLLPSLAASIKLGGAAGLPPEPSPSVVRLVGLAVLNLVWGVAFEGLASSALASILGGPLLRTSSTLPLPWQMVKHGAVLLCAREIVSYYTHRYVLHAGPSSSSSIRVASRLHEQYAHSRMAPPFSLAILTDHPLPYLLHRVVPILLPALVLRPHLLTYFVVVALVTLEETLATSGYSIVPGIIMGGMTRRTAVHYAANASDGAANFGPWGVLDWMHGTSRGGDVVDDVKAEGKKHKLKMSKKSA